MADEQNTDQKGVEPVAPGTVVTPGGAPTAPPPETPQQAVPAPQTPPSPADDQTQPIPDQPPSPPETTAPVTASPQDDPDSITWLASEFVSHDKTAEWYFLLAAGALAAAGLMYVIMRDFVSVAVIIVAALVFGVYGAHKPRQLQYKLNLRGVSVGDKFYPYNDFRSFSVVAEGALSSITLMPLKRFAVPLSIYYPPEQEDVIVGLLSQQLPYEQRRRDAVDSLMRKVRF